MNTEQFDGHRPGPWELIANYSEGEWDNTWEGSVHLFITLGLSIDSESLSVADARLIEAAPDLLAEVKRLREENTRLRQQNDYLWEHRSSHWSAEDDAEMDRLEAIE